jgi:hypothetical protein
VAKPELEVVYDLRDDQRRVDAMQAVSRRGQGLSDDPALVGSEDWWRLVDGGRLPLHVIEGTIGDSYWTGHGDFPEFDLHGTDGASTTWQRLGDETRYATGLAIQLRYVEHPWHPEQPFVDLVGPSSGEESTRDRSDRAVCRRVVNIHVQLFALRGCPTPFHPNNCT